MKSLFILFFGLVTRLTFCQTIQADSIVNLDVSLNETSGIVILQNKIITHNDSGGNPFLFEIDTLNGTITRQVVVSNATNVDWEDICFDDDYIYIGDIGNNLGNRTNLKVYKILISDYFNTPNDTVNAEIISFSYSNQTDFTPQQFSTNFDAEALISFNDSLYIFTKNWGNNKTNIYALSKDTGNYSISVVDSIDTQGLISGAVYNESTHQIVLVGYGFNAPFIVFIQPITSSQFSNANISKYNLTVSGSFQVESICNFDSEVYYLTSETYNTQQGILSRFSSDGLLVVNSIPHTSTIYPNPFKDELILRGFNNLKVDIYNSLGQLLLSQKIQSNDYIINTNNFEPGIYFLKTETTMVKLIK